MWTAIWITLLVFGFIISGMLVLKRSADKFKLPPNIKPQPYEDDDDDPEDSKQDDEDNS